MASRTYVTGGVGDSWQRDRGRCHGTIHALHHQLPPPSRNGKGTESKEKPHVIKINWYILLNLRCNMICPEINTITNQLWSLIRVWMNICHIAFFDLQPFNLLEYSNFCELINCYLPLEDMWGAGPVGSLINWVLVAPHQRQPSYIISCITKIHLVYIS